MSSLTPAAPFPSKLNRRRYTRVPTRQMRSCFAAHGVGPADGWVVDISLGGVFLRTPWLLPVGQEVAIELPRMGKAAPVCVRGRVVSSATAAPRPGMGVHFEPLEPKVASDLRQLVSSLAPAGTRLELSPDDIEVTRFAPVPSAPPAPPAPAAPPLPKLTAARPAPILPVPQPRPSVPQPASDSLELSRLKTHTTGLLMQLGELQCVVDRKNREIEALRQAIANLQASNAQLRRQLS